MRTIEEIRISNYKRLVDELREDLGREPSGKEVADFLGISSAYVSQFKTGARENIDSHAARKMEAKAKKPRGWLDTDFEVWPFPGIDRSRFDALTRSQRDEIQGMVRAALLEFEAKRAKLRAA